MSYQVIARKWRPQTFEEVTGQEAITRTLRNAIEFDRLHHAYIFSGARGVGKTTTARLLAKALNCHKFDKPTVTPCALTDPTACASCREIAEGRSIDVLEIDAASNTGVDNVREAIIENVNIAPARDRYKVFIIDEVHMLSNQAFNALLKTLEEPPSRVMFVMATTELHKVPDTILSRCQQFEFRTIALQKIFERLKIIAAAENINVTDRALREVARAGEGSMRDAQSAFDQTISFSGEQIDVEDVAAALGIAGSDLLGRVVWAIAEAKPVEALTVVDELIGRGQDLRNFCRDLLTHLRDLLVAKVAGDAEQLLESATTSADELQRQTQNFSESDLVRFFHSLAATETELKAATQPRYVLEVGLVKLIEMRRVVGIEKILERLAKLEAALANGSSSSSSNSPSGSTPGGKTTVRENAAISGDSSAATFAPVVPNIPPPFKTANIAETNLEDVFPLSADSFEGLSLVRPDNSSGFAGSSAVAPSAAFIKPQPPAPPQLRAPFVDKVNAHSPETPQTSVPVSPLPTNDGDARGALLRALDARNLMWLAISLEKAATVTLKNNALLVEFAVSNKQYKATWEKPENVALLNTICEELWGRQLNLAVETTGLTTNKNSTSNEPNQQQRADEELWLMAEADPSVQEALRVFRGKITKVWREEPGQTENQTATP